MEQIYVAKSYQSLERVGDPYVVNGKRFIKVRMKNGSLKQVRAYDFKEYKKYYPDAEPITKEKVGTQRDVLGFGEQGWIWVFKGDTYSVNDWFKAAPTRFTRFWGWYLPSDMEMPDPLPAGITPTKLYWEQVGKEDGWLKTDEEVTAAVESVIYDAGTSVFMGTIGVRMEVDFVCTKVIQVDGAYGQLNVYTFHDEAGNEYVWMTNSKILNEGTHYVGKGTVKAHQVYHGVNQTHLSRCALKEVEE